MWGIRLNRNSPTSLSRQIYNTLKEQIINGVLDAGEALPSTRLLASQLGISRNTASEAYEMLLAEGFVTSRQGASTRVADGLHIDKPLPNQLHESPTINEPPLLADFDTGKPELRHFPRYQWLLLMRKAYEQMELTHFEYSGPDGLSLLREEISSWLLRSRGLSVEPCDIFITAGATHALHVVCELLCQNGKGLYIEDPCHIGMLRVLQAGNRPVFAVPVDAHGLVTDRLTQQNAGGVYVTPSHQFPLGGILPASRRAALIRFALENDLFIIEDDYDSEFRYSGEPIAPICSMDKDRVIYIGTFSKVLFPALRIGYMVLPCVLHRQWRRLRTYTDVQNPPFEQATLAEYMRTRKFDRYVHQMRRLYGERRKVLLSALKQSFGETWRAWGDAAGLHIAIEFDGMVFDTDFMKKARGFGIEIIPVDHHCIEKGQHLNKLLLGYGHLEPDEIHKGVQLLCTFIRQ